MATPTNFSKTQIILHWTIAAMVLFQILIKDGIKSAWDARLEGLTANVPSLNPHVIIGMVIFGLMAWRLIIHMKRGVPAHPILEVPILGPQADSPIIHWLSKGTHWLFYALLLLMPISGALAWGLGIEPPANMHSLAARILVPLIIFHFAAAMVHHFLLKTNVLKGIFGMK